MKMPDPQQIIKELQSLDPKSIGNWPLFARVAALVLLYIAVLVAGYYFLILDQRTELAQLGDKETSLKTDFESKAAQAANLDTYKKQLDDMQKSFGTMLKQLPGQTEIPSLLQDISQTAQVDGLKQDLFKPGSESPKDFYAEKPIDLVLEGNYHEFGKFVSDVAALPRIVTLHDIDIKPASGDSTGTNLTMTLQAKTYRYLEDNEQQAAKPAKKAGGG
jgi:type IV pilus assembly protein PilO